MVGAVEGVDEEGAALAASAACCATRWGLLGAAGLLRWRLLRGRGVGCSMPELRACRGLGQPARHTQPEPVRALMRLPPCPSPHAQVNTAELDEPDSDNGNDDLWSDDF